MNLRRPAAAPTLERIRALEARYNITLPDSYRHFLMSHNGGSPDNDRDMVRVPGCSESPVARIHFFFGIDHPLECYDIAWNIDHTEDLPLGMIATATTEGADTFCMALDSSGVVFWDGYDGTIYPLAESFEAFIDSLYMDERDKEPLTGPS